MTEIKAINDLSATKSNISDNTQQACADYYHSLNTNLGGYWCSYRTIPKSIKYQAQLPAGIHLGAGTAAIVMQGKSFGRYSFSGALASYFIQPEGKQEIVQTTLKKGQAKSCGLFIPFQNHTNIPVEVAIFIDKFATKTSSFQGSPNISPLLIEKLCAPIDPWYQGDAQKLLAEARAYELLATIMAAFAKPLTLAKANIKHALTARDILESNLMKAPTLQVLAKATGTNVRSLTQVFRQQFGVSINQYISERRMEKALTLLEQGLSVSATAYQVGYSLPYFSEKFQQRFGLAASHVTAFNALPNS